MLIDISNIKRVHRSPRLLFVKLLRSVNQMYHSQLYSRPFNPEGVNIFEEDWDNLIILDACRFDTFEDLSELPGTLDSTTSRGSTTYEFVRANFSDRDLHDTVYVSANGWFKYLADEIDSEVHEFVGLHTEAFRGQHGITTPPEVVTKHAKQTAQDYPNKRLIVHYLQPHSPYIGPFGREHFEMGVDIYDVINKSDATTEDLRKAYNENLEIVLDQISELITQLEGKTVVTADHGEMLGEKSGPIPFTDYGHSARIYLDELVKVPWNVIEGDTRKKIITESPGKKPDETDESDLEEHLKDLGYKM